MVQRHTAGEGECTVWRSGHLWKKRVLIRAEYLVARAYEGLQARLGVNVTSG